MKISRRSIVGGIGVLALISLGSFLPTPVSANTCGGPYPPKPARVWAKSGPGGGQVTIYWDKAPHANRYAVAYGNSSGSYQYGADNIGGESSTSYTVSSLTPGVNYYFRLAAARDCASSPFSDEVSSRAGSGPVAASWSENKTSMQTASYMKNSNLSAWPGPAIGEVTVKWWGIDADNYHISYGTNAANYEYGALNIGKINQFTVKSLVPGKTYHFSVVPVGGSHSMNTFGPVTAVAKAPVAIVEISQATDVEPLTMATPLRAELVEDPDEPVDIDETDYENEEYEEDIPDEDEDDYENENTNVMGFSDEYEYEEEDDNYASENLAVGGTELAEDQGEVQGVSDESEYDSEYAQYAAENLAVSPDDTGDVFGIEDDGEYEPEDENYALENETTGNEFRIGAPVAD